MKKPIVDWFIELGAYLLAAIIAVSVAQLVGHCLK